NGLSRKDCGKKKLLLVITIVGILNSLSILFSGIFNESTNYPVHFVFSLMIFITLVPVLILTGILLIKEGMFSKILSILSFILAAFNIFFVIWVFTIGTSRGAIIEWISVFSYNGWALLNAINLLINTKSFIRLNIPTNQ
ncbi:MAG: hypothetical protein FK733_18775, partial [Asgard group archaeon]|nr:hypothetical protein [Asgard group archaeon]